MTRQKSFILSLFFIFFSVTAFSQVLTSMEKWKPLLNQPQLAQYFSGIFDKMGFVVEETNEQFTVNHFEDHFTLEKGVNKDSVDYVIHLKMENIDNMLKHGSDNVIDEKESFRIMSVLFTPLTEASLTNPVFNSFLMRKLSGIDNHIHVSLISTDKQDTVSHTLIFINDKWLVIPGLHGKAKRVFLLGPNDTMEFQRKIFVALKSDSKKDLRAFKKWYLKWRKEKSFKQ